MAIQLQSDNVLQQDLYSIFYVSVHILIERKREHGTNRHVAKTQSILLICICWTVIHTYTSQ